MKKKIVQVGMHKEPHGGVRSLNQDVCHEVINSRILLKRMVLFFLVEC